MGSLGVGLLRRLCDLDLPQCAVHVHDAWRAHRRDRTVAREAGNLARLSGPGDALFGRLADLARLLPMLPLIGAGRTRLQPVYVEDVAEAVARLLADPVTASRTYETTAPSAYTLRELVGITLHLIRRRRAPVPAPLPQCPPPDPPFRAP